MFSVSVWLTYTTCTLKKSQLTSRCSATDPYIFNLGQITRGITHTWQETTPRFVSPPPRPSGGQTHPLLHRRRLLRAGRCHHRRKSHLTQAAAFSRALGATEDRYFEVEKKSSLTDEPRWRPRHDRWCTTVTRSQKSQTQTHYISKHTGRKDLFVFLQGGGGDDSISWEPPELHHKSATGPEVLSLTPPMSSWVVGESDGE